MPYDILTQVRLLPGAPPGWNPGATPPIQRALVFEPQGRFGLAFKYAKVVADLYNLNIAIDADCMIELTLDTINNANWRWSKDLEAITTKKDVSMLYGEVEYEQSDGSWKTSKEAGHNCLKIRFKARANRYGGTLKDPLLHHPEKNHGFSLNIDIMQPDGTTLPITLDPDMKNPPPGDGGLFDSPFLAAY